MSGNCFAVPKEKTPRCKEFTAFVKTLSCCAGPICSNDVVPAHQPMKCGGMGMKGSDFRTIPLCNHHHTAWEHQKGEHTFETEFGISIALEVIRTQEKFLVKLLKEGRIK